MHPDGQHVATGQIGNRSEIHIWEADTLEVRAMSRGCSRDPTEPLPPDRAPADHALPAPPDYLYPAWGPHPRRIFCGLWRRRWRGTAAWAPPFDTLRQRRFSLDRVSAAAAIHKSASTQSFHIDRRLPPNLSFSSPAASRTRTRFACGTGGRGSCSPLWQGTTSA